VSRRSRGATGRPRGPRAALVLLAAGSGSRVGADTNKVLLPLAGRRVLTWSLTWTDDLPWCVRTVVVLREQDHDAVRSALAREAGGRAVDVVTGGSSRHESELNALRLLAPQIRSGDVDVVVIHDAARPLTGPRMFDEVARAAHLLGGALPVLPQHGLVGADSEVVVGSDRLVTVQTPQAFRALPLLEAYESAAAEGFTGTDTAACMERYSDTAVRGLPGAATNIKVTFPEDLFLAERILAMNHYEMP
jgi:2-C-methyl-D-erythritol 4-phosphate cytidylyltransferase